MKQITNKEYEEWMKYKEEKATGHILLPDACSGPAETTPGRPAEKAKVSSIEKAITETFQILYTE